MFDMALLSVEGHPEVVTIENLKFQGRKELFAKVNLFQRAHHPNILVLLGFCDKKEHMLLAYEYMAFGSLYSNLIDLPPGRQPLDWETRVKIAIDVASGLQYLHETMLPRAVHNNLNSKTIFLGEGYHAKLSDFGTGAVCSAGDKADIYNLGVVLLELISGKLSDFGTGAVCSAGDKVEVNYAVDYQGK